MTVHIAHQTRSIVVPYSAAFDALFPHGTRFTWNSSDMFAVPHGRDETIALRNMEYPVPAPIVEHYSFPSADKKRPFAKQVLTAASMTMNPFSYVLNGMGTGKTKSAIWAFDYLQQEGLANRMLVVAPLSHARLHLGQGNLQHAAAPKGRRPARHRREAPQAARREGRHLHHQP